MPWQKAALFLTADGVFAATGSYAIRHSSAGKTGRLDVRRGRAVRAMSLAAMPPQAGFVSEWYVFQTVFQGFHLPGLAGRLVLALAGAGLALTAAVAFATFIKVFGIGLLGGGNHKPGDVGLVRPRRSDCSARVFWRSRSACPRGFRPGWLHDRPNSASTVPQQMHDGLLLVPLTAKFAFISPSLLVIVMPLLALLPIGAYPSRASVECRSVATPVWYGGVRQDVARTATTALTFSNALRTFYSFIYRPTAETTRESSGANTS